ncbi:uncharacterized protein LOC131430432 [Malaya genurostris]|uniref:uncharacterized protein LOC131430432 n=1 Tax=Malaya genurostris TaxID=325434 RepID=UPI0026F3C212|nr:uncharacterized protein LOC131430432 [Malaya genurostris]
MRMEEAMEQPILPGQLDIFDEQSNQDHSCWLCQSVNRPLAPLFSEDPSSELNRQLIFTCLEIEVHHRNADASVCTDCIDKLNSFSWFSHQVKGNDSFLKQFPEEFIRDGERFCRLCLATNGHLHQEFFEDGQPNFELGAIIEECTGVEVNCYRNYKSHICTMCRTQLEMFVTFKRICRHIREKNKMESSNETEEFSFEPVEDENGTALLGFLLSDDESNEQKAKRKRTEKDLPKSKPKKVKSSTFPTVKKKTWKTVDRKDIFRMLWSADDERSFEVIKEKKGRASICVAGYVFYFCNVKPDGSSVWNCEWRKLHKCSSVASVSADGKIASLSKNMQHTHGTGTSRLMMCPPGKGFILQKDGTKEPLWLLHFLTAGRSQDRQLIYRGRRYSLNTINNDNDTSEWICRHKSCRSVITVTGIFKLITPLRGVHQHPQITEQEIREALISCKIKKTSEDVITPFREKNVLEWRNKSNSIDKLTAPQIYTTLASRDADRNYEVFEIRGNRYKILHRGHFYKYYLRETGGSSIWKCVWESIHNCMAIIAVSNDGKTASNYGQVEHTHPFEFADIFTYHLKEYSVRNITGEIYETVQLLSRECLYFFSRAIVHQNHIYNLRLIVNSETRWACHRLDAQRRQCPVVFIVNGHFETFLIKGEHCHTPMSKHELEQIVKPGNILELSALKSDEQVSNDDTVDSINLLSMLKQQLFTYPAGRGTIWDKGENKYFSFYFVTDNNNKRSENPYKVFYQQYRYSFASINEDGTSQWICCKLINTNTKQGGTCTAHLTIEGLFKRITAKGSHNHDGIPKTMVEYLCSNSNNVM